MKFILSFFLFTLIILGFFTALVTTVDPYSKLGNNPWGFVTKAVAQSRENKFIMLENSKTKYEAYILGSSAAHRFPTKTVKEITGFETFNYSAQHTTPEDYLAMLRHIMSKGTPKLIMLQIGFVELDQNYKTDNRLYNSSLAKYLREQTKPKTLFDNNYFTLDAIRDSFRVIYVNKWGEALHSKYTEHGNYEYEKQTDTQVKLQQSSYAGWELDTNRLDVLKQIFDLCEKHNTRLILFTAPLAYDHFEIAVTHPKYPEYIKSLNKVFGGFWNFHTESIKNYSSYKEFHNSTHMTHEFSDLLLRRILTGKPEDLGEYVSPQKNN